MSDYIDKFIKQHKDYFARNKSLIESSGWEDIRLQKKGKNVEFNNEKKDETRRDLFKQDHDLVKSILGRLSVFIKNTKGDRHLKKCQRFIDDTASIINIFLEKCDGYISKNDQRFIDSIDDSKSRGVEILFQDYMQNNKFKTEDSLLSLNITNSIDNTNVTFYKDEKSSLLMRRPLVLKNRDIKMKVDSMNVDWDIMNSSDFYINKKDKDIPEWNHKKHFFEQSQDVLDFWNDEFNKITKGITIGGYEFHPWLYWHLNFFKTTIPVNGVNDIINPYLRDNEWFFAENLKIAETPNELGIKNKSLLLYGTRRFSKSVIMASFAHQGLVTIFDAVATVTGGSAPDLTDLVGKIRTSLDYIESPFKLIVQNSNWSNGDTVFGLKENASDIIKYSTLRVKNLDAGSKQGKQKTAGGYASRFIMDEIGKFDFLEPFLTGKPSFADGNGNYMCVPLLAGTGGNADLSKEAVRVLANPESFGILPMQWDLLESKLRPEDISWKRRAFATFFPAQMAYGEGMTKSKKPLNEFLGTEEDIEGLDIQVSDWKKNLEYVKNERKLVSKDKLVLQQKTVASPLDPEDCLISTEENPFPTVEARKHKEFLQEEGVQGMLVDLIRNQHGRIIAQESRKELAEFPFQGGFHDAPVVLYEDIPENTPPLWKYVAGLDDYKQEESSGDSVGSIVIYNRETGRIAATYNSRPDPHSYFHKVCLMLLEAFNAECFMENEDMGFKEFLDRRHLTEKYIVKGINFLDDIGMQGNKRRKYGWQPTPKNKSFLMGICINHVKDPIEMDDGTEIPGIYTIDDLGILEEMLTYKKGQNVDRITSLMSALGYDYYLTANYIVPSLPDEKKQKKKASGRSRRPGMYGKRRFGMYRK